MAGHSRVTAADSGPQAGRLDSWKEIASYLNRHVTTVRRWERLEGLPVHRHRHSTLGSVYAYATELDAWFRGRRPEPVERAGAKTEAASDFHLPPPTLLALHSSPVALMGRSAEWRTLETAWDAARQGRHQLLLLTGEPGIGKTRLAFEFARSVSAIAAVLVGRCDSEQLVPFAPFVELLQWVVRECPADVLRDRLAKVDGSIELAQLLPDLATRLRMRSRSVPLTSEGHRYRMFEAFAGLLRATSRREPVLLVIEDFHWADRGSMLLLRHLVRATHDARICTLATYCESEASQRPGCEEIVADLRREPSATHVALGGLPEQCVRDFVGTWMDRRAAPHVTELVAVSTQGNPLFIIEMLRHLTSPALLSRLDAARTGMSLTELGLPESLRELIGRRLSGLTDSCNKLLTLAAVTGREFHISTLEALDTCSEEEVLDAMDAAVAANVLREVPGVPGRFSFTHAIVRETLYSRLTAARRVRLHLRVAEELERQSAAGTMVPVAELAHHFHEAAAFKDAAKAVDYAIRAAGHAASGLALEEAARYYGMALDALDFLPHDPAIDARRFDLHERRGRNFFQVGQWASARQEFERALTFLDAADEVRRCELLVKLAEAAFWLMDVPELRRVATEAQRLAEAVNRDDLWADAMAWMASADVADGDMSGAIESDRRAVARAGGIRSFGLARVPLTLYWAGHTAEAVEGAARAVERARGSGDPAFLLYALQHWGLSLSGAGRYDDALEAFEEAHTFGRRCGALPLLARAISMSVAPLLSLGDLEGAAARAHDARALAHRVAFEPPIVSAGIDLLLIAARSGAPERSDTLLPEVAGAVEKASGWHAWKWRLRLSQARAELALARSSWSEALSAARQVVEQSRARKRPKYEALGLTARARAESALGLKEATKSARDAAAVSRTLGDPAVLLNCLDVCLEIDPRDATRREAAETVQRVLRSLSPEALKRRFLASLPGAIRAHV